MGLASRVCKMIANLGCGNRTIAVNAERNLIKYGPRAAAYLAAACDDENPEVRIRAVWALGKVGGPIGFEAIAKLCHDPDDRVAYDARVVMGYFGDPRGVPVLIECMLSDPGGGAEMGLANFGQLAVNDLLPFLHHEDDDARRNAAFLLARLMPQAAMLRIREIIFTDQPDVAFAVIDGVDSGIGRGWKEFLLEIEALGPPHVAEYIDSLKTYWS